MEYGDDGDPYGYVDSINGAEIKTNEVKKDKDDPGYDGELVKAKKKEETNGKQEEM